MKRELRWKVSRRFGRRGLELGLNKLAKDRWQVYSVLLTGLNIFTIVSSRVVRVK